MGDIPDAVRRELIAKVYRHADHLDWDTLTQADRSAWYDRWVDDPGIGGTLTRFIPRERARVWLKDVPMKHYSRARSGVGPYSDLVTRRLPGPEGVAAQVFGASWRVIDGTVQDKPNRCRITDTRNERLMIWGPPNNLRALIWAGLNSAIDDEPAPAIVVTTLQGQPLAPGERRRHILLAQRVGLDVFHTTLRATIELSPDHATGLRDA
jgi:hypothetical protein